MKPLMYLSAGKVERLNALALALVPAKRADTARLVAADRLDAVLKACERTPGDVFAKAAVLLAGLVQQHPFASGNRRTAMLAATVFVQRNGGRTAVADDAAQARVLQGIRERHYHDDEIEEWLKTGKIRPFAR